MAKTKIVMTKDVVTKDGARWHKGLTIITSDQELKQREVASDSYRVVGEPTRTKGAEVSGVKGPSEA